MDRQTLESVWPILTQLKEAVRHAVNNANMLHMRVKGDAQTKAIRALGEELARHSEYKRDLQVLRRRDEEKLEKFEKPYANSDCCCQEGGCRGAWRGWGQTEQGGLTRQLNGREARLLLETRVIPQINTHGNKWHISIVLYKRTFYNIHIKVITLVI